MLKTKIMGILNATPDSFHTSSRCVDLEKGIAYGLDLGRQGADLIDIGGESTRPDAAPVDEEEELRRVIPLIEALSKQQPLPISIDTMKPIVAEKAIAAGATIINDVSGFRLPQMRELAASTGSIICVTHMLGTPKNMQITPYYEDGVVASVMRWFETSARDLLLAGVKKDQIILDPGIGFGKTVADNLEILHNLPKFKALGFPLLLGISRKSFMQKILNTPASELLPATLAINTIVIRAGVEYIRVHDIKEHKQAISILSSYEDHMTHTLSKAL